MPPNIKNFGMQMFFLFLIPLAHVLYACRDEMSQRIKNISTTCVLGDNFGTKKMLIKYDFFLFRNVFRVILSNFGGLIWPQSSDGIIGWEMQR